MNALARAGSVTLRRETEKDFPGSPACLRSMVPEPAQGGGTTRLPPQRVVVVSGAVAKWRIGRAERRQLGLLGSNAAAIV